MDKKITTKNMPYEQQPDKKFKKYGMSSLTDAELLAIIIRSGSKNERSVDLAARIVSDEKPGHGVLNIIRYSYDELKNFQGIGPVKALQIKAVGELSRRINKKVAYDGLSFNDSSTIANYYMEQLRHEDREHVIIMLLNNAGYLIKEFEISLGTSRASCVSPREIFIEALKYSANQVVMVHNHPSGSPVPSMDDFQCTAKIQEAGMIVGIPLIDHIIIGDKKYMSLKQLGKL